LRKNFENFRREVFYRFPPTMAFNPAAFAALPPHVQAQLAAGAKAGHHFGISSQNPAQAQAMAAASAAASAKSAGGPSAALAAAQQLAAQAGMAGMNTMDWDLLQ
jgi:hypothetical protein